MTNDERLRIEGILIATDSIIETYKEVPDEKFNREVAIGIIEVLAKKFKNEIKDNLN